MLLVLPSSRADLQYPPSLIPGQLLPQQIGHGVLPQVAYLLAGLLLEPAGELRHAVGVIQPCERHRLGNVVLRVWASSWRAPVTSGMSTATPRALMLWSVTHWAWYAVRHRESRTAGAQSPFP